MPMSDMWGGVLGGIGAAGAAQAADPNFQGQWSSSAPGNPFVCQYCYGHGCSGQCQQNFSQQPLNNSASAQMGQTASFTYRDNTKLMQVVDPATGKASWERVRDINGEPHIWRDNCWTPVSMAYMKWREGGTRWERVVLLREDEDWCDIHHGLRKKGAPCLYCEPVFTYSDPHELFYDLSREG